MYSSNPLVQEKLTILGTLIFGMRRTYIQLFFAFFFFLVQAQELLRQKMPYRSFMDEDCSVIVADDLLYANVSTWASFDIYQKRLQVYLANIP
jgi:hypothetical protein